MSETLHFPRIEVRSSMNNGIKKYIVKGYATTVNNIYSYEKISDKENKPVKSLKEFFTPEAVNKIKQKAQNEKIWVDYGHQTAFNFNAEQIISSIETRSGLSLKDEKEYFKNAFKVSDLPMFKLEELQVDDKGIFVEIHGNPFYREYDDEHQKIFDATWKSLENGFINGLSLNMKPKFTKINDELQRIDDADIFGISLLSGASNEQANITEVLVRCCMNKTRGETECLKPKKLTTSLLM